MLQNIAPLELPRDTNLHHPFPSDEICEWADLHGLEMRLLSKLNDMNCGIEKVPYQAVIMRLKREYG